MTEARTGRTLIIACGALTREIRAVLSQLPGGDTVDVEYLPAHLHNRPEKIAPAVDELLMSRASSYDHVAVGYADCGTGGHLDAVLARHGVSRLSGAHCYDAFAGQSVFRALQDAEPGTFYLTDFLARHFHQLVFVGLGLDRHPQLRDTYFGNYTRLVLLSQTDSRELVALGQEAASKLGLSFVHHHVGLEPLALEMKRLIPLRVS